MARRWELNYQPVEKPLPVSPISRHQRSLLLLLLLLSEQPSFIPLFRACVYPLVWIFWARLSLTRLRVRRLISWGDRIY